MTEDLSDRTKKFALRILKVASALPKNYIGDVIGRQLIKAGTSVAANHRASKRAKSKADFINKINIVEEEADESLFWLEFIVDAGLMKKELLADLLKEANELTAIFTAAGKTAKQKYAKKKTDS